MRKKLLPPIHSGEILREEFMQPLGLSANALAQRAASEGWEGSSQTILLARRTRTIKLCSSDARSEEPSDCAP